MYVWWFIRLNGFWSRLQWEYVYKRRPPFWETRSRACMQHSPLSLPQSKESTVVFSSNRNWAIRLRTFVRIIQVLIYAEILKTCLLGYGKNVFFVTSASVFFSGLVCERFHLPLTQEGLQSPIVWCRCNLGSNQNQKFKKRSFLQSWKELYRRTEGEPKTIYIQPRL